MLLFFFLNFLQALKMFLDSSGLVTEVSICGHVCFKLVIWLLTGNSVAAVHTTAFVFSFSIFYPIKECHASTLANEDPLHLVFQVWKWMKKLITLPKSLHMHRGLLFHNLIICICTGQLPGVSMREKEHQSRRKWPRSNAQQPIRWSNRGWQI